MSVVSVCDQTGLVCVQDKESNAFSLGVQVDSVYVSSATTQGWVTSRSGFEFRNLENVKSYEIELLV